MRKRIDPTHTWRREPSEPWEWDTKTILIILFIIIFFWIAANTAPSEEEANCDKNNTRCWSEDL